MHTRNNSTGEKKWRLKGHMMSKSNELTQSHKLAFALWSSKKYSIYLILIISWLDDNREIIWQLLKKIMIRTYIYIKKKLVLNQYFKIK